MEQILLLNATFEPLQIINWQRAMTLLFNQRVEVIEYQEGKVVRSVTLTFKLPSVVRLLRYVKVRRGPTVPFSRANIYARDKYVCQYCHRSHKIDDLTFDHVIPVSQGGSRTWTNIVTACLDCNRKKGGRTPEEAGMKLKHPPIQPMIPPVLKITVGLNRTPDSWRSFLYWNAELEQ